MSEKETGRRVELDGIRAVAVLLVFVTHTGYSRVGPTYLGVNMFFVLSGYLITGLLVTEHRRHGRIALKQFYIRRALRLVPALLTACLLVALFALDVRLAPTGTVIRNILCSLFYVQDFFAAIYAHSASTHIVWLGTTWSLAVEEQFYLVWPLVLIALFRSQRALDIGQRLLVITVGLMMLAAISTVAIGSLATYFSPLGSVFQLAAGALLACRPIRLGRWWPPILFIAVYAGMWAVGAFPGNSTLFFGEIQGFTLGSVILIAWAVQHASPVLSCRPLVWLGRRSYGFYLYHYPILVLLENRHFGSRSTIVVTGFCLSLLAAGLSFRFIESPFLARKAGYTVLSSSEHSAAVRLDSPSAAVASAG